MATYTTKLGDKICEHTTTSSIGLRHICKQLGMPYSTVTSWIYNKDHELYGKYIRAKRMQLYHIEEEILEIADDSTNDYMTIVKNGKNVVVQNREAIARSRLRIQTRITLLTKLAPRLSRYDHDEVDFVITETPSTEESPAEDTKQPAPQLKTHAHVPSPSPSERAGVRPQKKTHHSSPKKTRKTATGKGSKFSGIHKTEACEIVPSPRGRVGVGLK